MFGFKIYKSDISVPNNIYIGNDSYINSDLFYERNLTDQKDWLGEILFYDGEFDQKVFNVLFAPKKHLLEFYKRNKYLLISQRLKIYDIRINNNNYSVSVDNKGGYIRTSNNEPLGYVVEVYKNSKLQGININMSFDKLTTFENAKKTVEYIFNCKLKEEWK